MFTRLLAGIGTLGLTLSAGAAIAAAEPDLSPAINTTCTLPQAISALDAQDPAAAAQFHETPAAQAWLSSFLTSPPPERQQMVDQIQGTPEAAPYMAVMSMVANTCKNY